MVAPDTKKIVLGINRIKQTFEELKPSLEQQILATTAVLAYHRPPIADEGVEELQGLIFPPGDLKRLHNRIAMFDIHMPKEPKVYLGIDEHVKYPKHVLRYGLQHLAEAPQKILQKPSGSFYLTRKLLLSGGNWMYPEIDLYIFEVHCVVLANGTKKLLELLEVGSYLAEAK